jgi:hypothetical protein
METRDIEIALQNVLDRQKPRLTNQDDTGAIGQMIRIYGVQILANLIQIQKPQQDFASCKRQATDQLLAAVSQDWQV